MSWAEEFSRKRWGGGGLMIIFLLLALLLVPLWKHRSINHPLAGQADVDPCPALPAAPVELGEVRAQRVDLRSSACTYLDARDESRLTVTISTTRQLAHGRRIDTEKMFDTFMKEVYASVGNGAEVPGKWRHAGAWELPGRQSLMFEDGGVMVVLESPALTAPQLQRHAELVQEILRHQK